MLAAEISHFAVGAQKWIVKGPAGCASRPFSVEFSLTNGTLNTAACKRGTTPNILMRH